MRSAPYPGGRALPNRIPEIRARVDLVALVEERAGQRVTRTNGTVWFHCPHPNHEDRDPSFRVKDGRWRCWSACAAHGDAIDFVKFVGVARTTAEAIDYLASRVGLSAPTSPIPRGALRPPPSRGIELTPDRAERLLQRYLEARALPREVASILDLRVVVDTLGFPRVRHPFRLRGREVYYADRAIDARVEPRWLQRQGLVPCPYEADRLGGTGISEVVVTEGISDAVTVIAAFAGRVVVGVPGAGGLKTRWAPAFADLTVVVVGDNDPAGETFVADVTMKLAGIAKAVRRAQVPPQHKDVAAWLVGVGDPERFGIEFEAAVALAGQQVRQ